MESLREIFERYFELKPIEGKSKVMPVNEAVSDYIKPGMHIYSAYLPFAIIHEIVRQFHGQHTAFTVSCLVGARAEKIVFLEERCVGCGLCAYHCPNGAIRLVKVRDQVPEKTPREIWMRVEAERAH